MSETKEIQQIANTHHWYNRLDVRFMFLVIFILVLYHGYGYVQGPFRISSELQQAIEQKPEGRFNIVIKSKFPPEEFHMGIYQEYGVMRGTTGKGATVYKVRTSGIKALSRYYWITEVGLAKPVKL